ncbi:unnamed protein product [Arabidopsis halleri]
MMVFVVVLIFRIDLALCSVGLLLVELSDSFFFGISGLLEFACLVGSS